MRLPGDIVTEDFDTDLPDFDEYSETKKDDEAYSAGRLLGVALFGALVSLGAYYVYQQLEPEKKAKLKKKASGMIAEQIHTLTGPGEDDDD